MVCNLEYDARIGPSDRVVLSHNINDIISTTTKSEPHIHKGYCQSVNTTTIERDWVAELSAYEAREHFASELNIDLEKYITKCPKIRMRKVQKEKYRQKLQSWKNTKWQSVIWTTSKRQWEILNLLHWWEGVTTIFNITWPIATNASGLETSKQTMAFLPVMTRKRRSSWIPIPVYSQKIIWITSRFCHPS